MDQQYQYDVALSFAGEDREYVEDVATFLKSFGVNVFYDKFEQADLWGKDLYEHLNDVYKNKAKYSILFISKFYKEKAWTNHERKSAQTRAFKESEEYILPIKFDDTEIPGLNETIGYLDARYYAPKDIAKFFIDKCGFNTKKRWWGKWERKSLADSFYGDLFINNVNQEGFYFDLIVQHGAHTGFLENEYAKFVSHNEAIFEGTDDRENICRISFLKINNLIQVSESNCLSYHGMRAYFDGDYHLQEDVFCYYDDIMSDEVLSKIYSLLNSKYWKSFKKCFNDTHENEDIDGFGCKVISGGMAGFYSIYEAIIMVGKKNEIWGAFLDADKVFYFTSEQKYKQKLPQTINKWRENFKEKEVIYLTEEMVQNMSNDSGQKDRLIGDFVEFLNSKKSNGEELYMTDEELEDFFSRCIN